MVTFLLTDVVGSTRLWEERPDDMAAALADHDAHLAGVVTRHGGELLKSRGEGDSTFSVFDDPIGAVNAALDGQRELAGGLFQVRMAIHTGDAEQRAGDYYGPTVNRCARLRGAAHGGQVVLSLITRQLTHDRLPAGATLLDLGVHHLRDLTEPERVYQLCHADLATDFPPLASLDSRHHNLPQSLTTFVGRTAELADIEGAITASRLVTLVGPGGVGKTRLALEAAAARVDQHVDGVWLVELAGITQPSQVLAEVASTLGLREEPGRSLTATLSDHLAGKTLLLVLDNCEHVIDAAAAAAERVLQSGPGPRVLATSRQILGIAGERAVPVPGLSTPEAAPYETSEAIALFVDRATQVNPRLTMTAIDRNALIEICRRLDGLPLAIELAAALVDRLSVSDIANRLIERFELLTTGSRTAEPRQRSLTAAIDWSYDLLESVERDAFAALSVFIGGFDLRGAEAVLGRGAIDAVGQLVAKSLVVHGEDHFSMLESIRVYAADRLASSGRVGQAHDRAVDWALALIGEGDRDIIQREHENLLAALRWASGRRPDDALALVDGLAKFWEHRGYWSEGRRLLADVLSQAADADPAKRARALHRAGRLAAAQGDFADAEALLRESLALADELDEDRIVERALTDLGGVAHMRGNIDDAQVHFEAALGMARDTGDPRGIASALGNLGIIAHATGRLDQAKELHREALGLARGLDDGLFLANVLENAAMVAEATGDLPNARAGYAEALELARRDGSPVSIATTLARLAPLSQEAGDIALARQQLNESLDTFRDLGDRPNVANVLYRLGELSRREGDYDDARKALDESLALWREIRHALGEAAVELSVGEVDRLTGDSRQALRRFRRALEGLRELRNPAGVASCLDHIAAVMAARPNVELAAELIGAADAIRDRMGAVPPSEIDRPLDPAEVRAKLGDDEFDRAKARGAALSEDQAVELALAAASAATT
jgi:predicted ATPase/class 3 adenylate cyclase/Tfp pilus assembly protein PilF